MIKVLNEDNIPTYLTSDTVKASKAKLRDQVNSGEKSIAIPNHWSDKTKANKIKHVLFTMHHGKCCYCERKRTRSREMDVEHYRPKARVDHEANHQGYWWLAYDWNNYLWSCKSCNQGYKKNEFPLLPDGVRAKNEDADLELENPCLINPRFEDPREYLAYYKRKLGGRWFVKVIALPYLSGDMKKRAEETIRILGLNRVDLGDDLVSERGESLSSEFEELAYGLKVAEQQVEKAVDLQIIKIYKEKISKLRKRLKRFVHSSNIFAGFFRHFLSDIDIDYSNLIEG